MVQFTKGQLVWAKIKGKSWWPALVAQTVSQKRNDSYIEIEVNFVGETLSANVNQDNIADFDAGFKEYSKNKGKKFQEVLKVALEIAKNNNKPQETHCKAQKGQKSLNVLEPDNEQIVARKTRGRGKSMQETEHKVKSCQSSAQKEAKKSGSKSKNKDTKKESASNSKTKDLKKEAHSMVVEDQKVKETMQQEKSIPMFSERVTRSHAKKGNLELFVEPLPHTTRKGRKPTATKEEIKSTTQKEPEISSARKARKSVTAHKEEKPSQMNVIMEIMKEKEASKMLQVPQLEKQPSILKSKLSHLPLPEKFQPRNLLLSITAEPSVQPHIEVTSSKKPTKGILKNALASQTKSAAPANGLEVRVKSSVASQSKSVTISEADNSNKRPSWMYFRDHPTSVYLPNDKQQGKQQQKPRGIGTDYIVKKVKGSPTFKDRMSSIQGTRIKNLQSDRNWVSKARLAYNSIMIKKFENDLEELISKLVKRFKDGEKLLKTDKEQMKMANIMSELEKNKFDGSEFMSSEIGKLLRTIHQLLIINHDLIHSNANELIATVGRVLHQVKDHILRFCLDNSEYVESFGMSENINNQSMKMEVDYIDNNEAKSLNKTNKLLSKNNIGLYEKNMGELEIPPLKSQAEIKEYSTRSKRQREVNRTKKDKSAMGKLALESDQTSSDMMMNLHSSFMTL